MTMLLALALLQVAAPQTDAAGNRLLPFPPIAPPLSSEGEQDPLAPHCTADRRWCARLRSNETQDAWELLVFEGMPADPEGADGRSYALDNVADGQVQLRNELVAEASGAVLIPVAWTRSTGYAGGGASATFVEMVRAEPGTAALQSVLAVSASGTKLIRSCFGEDDQRRRRGACHDEYEFTGTLTLDPATREGRPRFLYRAQARTYPGRIDPNSNSTTDPPLRRQDLRWWTDPVCTYRRSLAFDAAAGAYRANASVPDCANYLDF